jgi:DNA helicase HerA-like ATPase
MDLAPHHPIDLTALLETRLLLQANSGGGKSWALRRILEQTASSVQQLVIDPEGEFSTLRKKFDYVIAAPRDGDALATPATASLLARRLLESGSSAILDIYDLKAHERIAFVRTFLDALVNAPKALWHPVLVALDEAHVYAPQSTRDESSGAVIDIATRDRKRGQCAGDVEGAHPGQGLASVPGREARSPVTARKNTPASASDL